MNWYISAKFFEKVWNVAFEIETNLIKNVLKNKWIKIHHSRVKSSDFPTFFFFPYAKIIFQLVLRLEIPTLNFLKVIFLDPFHTRSRTLFLVGGRNEVF